MASFELHSSLEAGYIITKIKIAEMVVVKV